MLDISCGVNKMNIELRHSGFRMWGLFVTKNYLDGVEDMKILLELVHERTE
jgi:hypothetical protein